MTFAYIPHTKYKDSVCKDCGKPIVEGSPCWWNKAESTALDLGCYKKRYPNSEIPSPKPSRRTLGVAFSLSSGNPRPLMGGMKAASRTFIS